MASAMGHTATDKMILVRVFEGHQVISERALRNPIQLGDERTFEQDPKSRPRLLVDIAMRAMSAAGSANSQSSSKVGGSCRTGV